MTSTNLHNGLMRPAILQVLRAAGFHNSSGAALDVMTDLAIRYLVLLASSTAQYAFNNHDDYVPTIQDVRMAMLEVGALRPQMSVLEERARGLVTVDGENVPFEDMRGTDGFLKWTKGSANREIRRIAGLASSISEAPGDGVEVGVVLDDNEDYVTALKKKYHRAGEESRYRGTLLGSEADEQPVTIVGGGPLSSIQDWSNQMLNNNSRTASALSPKPPLTPESSTISSAPLTPMEDILVGAEGE